MVSPERKRAAVRHLQAEGLSSQRGACALVDECLNCEFFTDLEEARVVIEAWREEYSTERPHSSLGYLTPVEFARLTSQGEAEATRCVGFSLRRPRSGRLRPTEAGRATPSLRPHSATDAATLSLQLVRRMAGGQPHCGADGGARL